VTSARNTCLDGQDWIGRWGGDEFLLGIHDELDAARTRIQRWLDAMEASGAPGGPVLASAGCAPYRSGMSPASLYRQADQAMYEAKFSGGHRLVCSSARVGHIDPESTAHGPASVACVQPVGTAAMRDRAASAVHR
jgi:diguanylate cyclase (GGDEF)-like protein